MDDTAPAPGGGWRLLRASALTLGAGVVAAALAASLSDEDGSWRGPIMLVAAGVLFVGAWLAASAARHTGDAGEGDRRALRGLGWVTFTAACIGGLAVALAAVSSTVGLAWTALAILLILGIAVLVLSVGSG